MCITGRTESVEEATVFRIGPGARILSPARLFILHQIGIPDNCLRVFQCMRRALCLISSRRPISRVMTIPGLVRRPYANGKNRVRLRVGFVIPRRCAENRCFVSRARNHSRGDISSIVTPCGSTCSGGIDSPGDKRNTRTEG